MNQTKRMAHGVYDRRFLLSREKSGTRSWKTSPTLLLSPTLCISVEKVSRTSGCQSIKTLLPKQPSSQLETEPSR